METEEKEKLTFMDLDRNDVESALQYAEPRLRDGTFGFEDSEMLIMLQDDPHELIRRLGELSSRIEEED